MRRLVAGDMLLHKIHQVVVHETRMRIVILGVHEAETILLIKWYSIYVSIHSQEAAVGVLPDCHCEPRRGEAIPI